MRPGLRTERGGGGGEGGIGEEKREERNSGMKLPSYWTLVGLPPFSNQPRDKTHKIIQKAGR